MPYLAADTFAGTLPTKGMGFILGVAVLADAFLVRQILVPALLALVGARAWWLPRWADRLLPDVRLATSQPQREAATHRCRSLPRIPSLAKKLRRHLALARTTRSFPGTANLEQILEEGPEVYHRPS